MKRFLILILAVLMVCALVSCNQQGDNTDDTTTEPGTSAPNNEETTTKKDETTTEPDPEETTTDTQDTTTEAPGTTEEPKIEVPIVPEGLMVYYEDFEKYADTTTNEDTFAVIGWKMLNIADGALTNNTGTYYIENGALAYRNVAGASDSYNLILTDEYMIAAAQRDYTVQYDIKYTDAGNAQRFANIILNYDGYDIYNSFHLRISGYGGNQVRFMGSSWIHYDLNGSAYYAADTNDTNESTSIIKKLTGQDYDSSIWALQDKWITVRIIMNVTGIGPDIYLRDNSQENAQFICVSKADPTTKGAPYWNTLEHYAVAFKLGATIDGYIDNIAIWTGLGEMPEDKSTTAYEAVIKDYLEQEKQ